MNAVTIWMLVGGLLIAAGLILYWYHHPAVRLKRAIKRRLEQEKQAKQQLDDAYEQARAQMEQAARKWRHQ